MNPAVCCLLICFFRTFATMFFKYHHVLVVLLVLLFAGCSASKYIPDGEYMLDRVVVKSDIKGFDAAQLEPYIRQKGNSKWFSVFKIPLGTYAMSGADTTKWINRTLRNMGEEPVLYDTLQARLSCEDLQMAMHNMGYMDATVSLDTYKKGKKLLAVYMLHPGEPYAIRRFNYDIQDARIASVLAPFIREQKVSEPNKVFTVNGLDAERKRVAKLLNDSGFYRFHKEYIDFSADSASAEKQIDVTMHLMRYNSETDAAEVLHPRYRIRNVIYTGNGDKLPLRKKILENTTAIEQGKYFSVSDLQNTYNEFGRLGAIRYTNIRFTEVADSLIDYGNVSDRWLDCHIQVLPNKPNTISFLPEGTNTAGDLGAAASLTYQNRNLFRGSELLSIQFRAAFEAITGLEGYENHDYEEYNIEGKLQFPRFVAPFLSRNFTRRSTASSELALSWNLQNRPEFHRRVFTATWRYRWTTASKRTAYNFDLLDLDYVYMPWISSTFKRDYIDIASSRNAILRYNYEDLLITKIGFGISYSDATHAVRANIETSGNVLRALSGAMDFKRNDQNQYTLFNIAYAQYAKLDFSYTKIFRIDKTNQLVMHGGLGVAYPYGNSSVLPFEKRYFSGGANSVRGWSVRELGPGSFRGTDGRIDFINQTGDVKLDLNLEYRSKLFWKFSGAAFVDAGNIWTIRAYGEQPGGQFKFDEFYRQLAASYGLGLRLNFDYFILRLDMGMKAVSPVYDSSKEHFPLLHPKFSRDFAFHFAVGMPF